MNCEKHFLKGIKTKVWKVMKSVFYGPSNYLPDCQQIDYN